MLPYFLRHYAPLCDRVIIFDDHSDDGGPALAAAYPNVEVRPYPGAGLDDIEFVEFAARTYPEARGLADWVVWVDADEFIYHHDLRGLLRHYQAQGITLPLVQGYAMFAERFPTTPAQIYAEVRCGTAYAAYSKPVVFDPRLELRWGAGKHDLQDAGAAVRSTTAEIRLLHFRHLGAEYFTARNARNYARMTMANIGRNLGFQVYPENQAGMGWESQVAAIRPKLERVL